jgi:glyoxylase-like metal-dependent hydrolase (beta-lactamase superfamily II)
MLETLPIGLLGANCYLIIDGRDCAIVDPGMPDPASLIENLAHRSLTVQYVLCTHGHFDHVAGLGRMDLGAAELGLHAADWSLLSSGGGAHLFGLPVAPAPAPTLNLVDGLSLSVGALHVEVCHTPGHTPGSVCLYIPEDHALLTGDTLFRRGVGRTDLPGGSSRDLSASLRRLLCYPAETECYPGHGPSTTLAREVQTNPWFPKGDPYSPA